MAWLVGQEPKRRKKVRDKGRGTWMDEWIGVGMDYKEL